MAQDQAEANDRAEKTKSTAKRGENKATAGAGQAESPRGTAGDGDKQMMTVGEDAEGKPMMAEFSRPSREERYEEDAEKRAETGAKMAVEVNVLDKNNAGDGDAGDENAKPARLYRK